MRAVLQRVRSGRVNVAERVAGEIGPGIVVLLGIGQEDNEKDAVYLAEKIIGLRIFNDHAGKINLDIRDVGGKLLVVSQFTLYWDCRKGRRPSFSGAAEPEYARRLYDFFTSYLSGLGVEVQTGEFQADMLVEINNDGPVTVLLDSKQEF